MHQLSANHKTLAIIPFDATIKLRPKDMKEMSAEDSDRLKGQEGESVQNALHSYFLKRQAKHKFNVNFQDVARTNAFLAKNGII